MSHLHLVDGVISPVWWILGHVISLAILLLAVAKVKKEELAQKVPFIGVLSALMLITMSVPLGFLPFHLNLTVLAGILAGPWIGFIAVFIVNLILAFIGHGGITVVGLNTLIIGMEVVVGYFLFKTVAKYLKPVKAVVVTVMVTLLISTSFMGGVVALTNAGMEHMLPQGHHEEEHYDETDHHDGSESNQHKELSEQLSNVKFFALSGWGAVLVILMLGIIIEAVVTAMVVGFFLKVRPDMIETVKIR